jgi:hypothetical protein
MYDSPNATMEVTMIRMMKFITIAGLYIRINEVELAP